MWKTLRDIIRCVAGILLLPACENGVPSAYIQPTELEDLLYDYHIAQAMAERRQGDSVNYRRYSYVQAVFDKYDVTEAEFDSTMIWYSSHATYLNDIYKRLKVRYNEHVTALGASTGTNDLYAHLDAQGDTANIWQNRSFYVLKPKYSEDRMSFTMEADTTFRKGDVLMWRFDGRVISRGRRDDAYAALYVIYENDSVAGLTKRIYSNSRMELKTKGDTAHAIRQIGGFVYFKPSDEDKEPRFLMLSDMMLVRFHQQPVKKDTVSAVSDSTRILPADSLRRVQQADTAGHRLSPTELRDSRKVERSIQVVKEKPYRVVRRSSTTRRERTDR